MRILAVGDVCGDIGCNEVRDKLPKIKKDYNIDVVIINGENSAQNNGITKESAQYLLNIGADVITGGNHSLRQASVYSFLDETSVVLRPYNLPDCNIGRGYTLLDFGRYSIFVMNLIGTVYFDRIKVSNPFIAADELIDIANGMGADYIFVDFHAEATSEKIALAKYLDGKVSAVFGTHTHVQTADNTILKSGTGYITDLGMTGPADSVLGVKNDIIINRFRNNDISKFEYADGIGVFSGCIFEIENATGKTVTTQRIMI